MECKIHLTRLDIRRYIMVKQDALMESLSSNLHGGKPKNRGKTGDSHLLFGKNRGQSPIILERLVRNFHLQFL